MTVAVAVPPVLSMNHGNFTCSSSRRLFGLRRSRSSLIPHHDLLDRLPNEIWSSIFHFAVHYINDDAPEDESYPGMFPLTISHVCSRWRRLALSAGSLWTHIVLTFPHSRIQHSRAFTWLSRSATYPVDLLLDFRDPNWDWEEGSHSFLEGDIRDVLCLLLPHVKRWRRFELLTDTWAPIYTFLQYSRHVKSAPRLQKLGLSRCNAYFASKNEVFQPSHLKTPIKLFGGIHLPELKHVALVGVHLDWEGSSLCNLLSLEIKYHAREVMPPLRDFVHMLTSCPNLRRLTILGWGPLDVGNSDSNDDLYSSLQRSVSLPQLVTLSFGFLDVDYALRLLSFFMLPSLRQLSLEDISKSVDHTEILDATPILDWLSTQSSSPCSVHDNSIQCTCNSTLRLSRITQLKLQAIRSSEDAYLRFFQQLSSVRRMSLSKIDSLALRALSIPLDGPAPCPSLRKLSYRGIDCQTLCELVIARAYSDSPIRELLLTDDCPELNEEALKLLEMCGVNVILDGDC